MNTALMWTASVTRRAYVSDCISVQHESESSSLGFRSEKWEEDQIILAMTCNKNQLQEAAINNAEL